MLHMSPKNQRNHALRNPLKMFINIFSPVYVMPSLTNGGYYSSHNILPSYNGATNAVMEGFNTKIRWLTYQAYGYHDYEYFKLKIYDLPKCSTKKKL